MIPRWHKIFHIITFSSIAALGIFVLVLRLHYRTELDGMQGKLRIADAIRSSPAAIEEVLGGKTPEETMDAFLTLLKVGDIAQASRYIIPQRRAAWRQSMEDLARLGALTDLADELSQFRTHWQQTRTEENAALYELDGRRIIFMRDAEQNSWSIVEL